MSKRDPQSAILIITHSGDNECIANVMATADEHGGTAYRFNTDEFPTKSQLSVRYSGDQEQLLILGHDYELDLSTVSAVWYRRIAIGQQIPKTMDAQLRRVSIDESRATIQGMIASLDAFHLDAVHRVRRADNKQLQLKVARELGIETPRTLITNNPDAARSFARECGDGMVMKTLSSFAIYEQGEQQVVFTNPVLPQDLEHLGELRYCPATFQEHVPKALELRATIVGNQVFTASIDSQQSDKSRTDWRRDGIGLLNDWEPYQLPAEIQQRLLRLMDFFGLNYGAADFIVTPDGRHVFLEVNPVGEFFWLERSPGLAISGAIAELLMTGNGAR